MKKTKPMSAKNLEVPYHHILAAVEGYLKSLTMIDDDDTVLEVSVMNHKVYHVLTEKEK